MRLKTNLRGQVRQTTLPKWRCLLPLFEAVMNSIQAIQDADPKREHSIRIECEREQTLNLDDDLSPFIKFIVRDTGIGFDDDNFDSFNTAFSEHKLDRGGKGLGRIMWLVAFEKAEIDSIFRADDSQHPWRRRFTFDTAYDPDNATPVAIDQGMTGTTIVLSGYQSPYKEECPRSAEALAQRLIEHFILVLLRSDCPKIEIVADGVRLSVNELFRAGYQANASEASFSVDGSPFTLHGFKITSSRANKHRLIYAANSRGVRTENLDDYILNLSTKLEENDGSSFVYLAIVQGKYLDQRVNNHRTDFEIATSDAAASESGEAQGTLLPEKIISISDIRGECIKVINDALEPYISALNDAKIEKIARYVKEEAPQYKPLMRYKADFIDNISPNATKMEMEIELHRELYKREVDIKRESNKMLTGAEKIDDYEAYREKLSNFIERYSELGTSALAHHVMHRKIIIEFLEKAISVNGKTGKYPLEQIVHNIIFPMQSTDMDTLYSQQNLWIIDERLTFHTYIASDKRIASLDGVESASAKRPDIAIFDKRISFSELDENDSPLNSLVVIEFKRPQRDDYTDEKNPVLQVFDQINDIRAGKIMNDAGRPIRTANTTVPSFAYVICDITPTMKKAMTNIDAMPTPDGLAYYGYHRTHQIYYEVIDYSKIVSDAKKRNRIFFERLKIDK